MIALKAHKGYAAEVLEMDLDTNLFHGRVLGLRDVLTFEAADPAGLQREFQATVDDYLAWAAEEGFSPEKPASGTFQVRTTSEIHRALLNEAKASKQKLNAVVNKYLARAI